MPKANYVVAVLAGLASAAQASAQTQNLPQSSDEVSDIVVTAQRRAERLQDVPIAVTALDAKTLDARAVTNVADIQRYTPGLNISSGRGTSTDAFIYIRGIGQNDDFFVADPATGIYIDGVYSSRTQGSLLTFQDVERIEVLRGPQGTLYGKNTIAGAVSVTSKLPDLNALDYRIDLAVGTYDQIDAQASVSVPLAPGKAALRVSGLSNYNGGFFRNSVTGLRTNDRNIKGGKATLLLAPTDQLKVTLRGDVTIDRSRARLGQVVGFNPAEAFVANINRIYAPRRLQDFILAPGADPWVGGSDLDPRADLDVYGVSGTIDFDVGAVALKSITAWRRLTQNTNLDIDNTPLFAVNSIRALRHQQFSQELQATGKALDNRLSWLLGAYYFEERATLLNDLPIVRGAVVTPGGPLDISNRRDAGARTESWAGFTQLSYEIVDGLNLTGGARFTRETKALRLTTSNPNNGVVTFNSNGFQSQSWTSFDPRIALDYRVSPELLLYASATSGFKSGGYNARAAVGGRLESFNPEKAWSYEVGFKSDLFDRKLRFNVAAFQIDYTDLQLTVFRTVNNAISQAVRNAGKARVRGLEVELTARPIPELDLFVSSAYTDARYLQFIDLVGGVPVDKSRNRFVNTPEVTLTLGGRYTAELNGAGRIEIGGDWAWQSRTWKEVDNDASLVQAPYAVANARLAYTDADDRFTLALIGRNLFDTRYLTTGAQISSFGAKVGWFGDPRTVSLQLTLRR
jgi:iron complex outermembrane recepter protein